MIYRPTDPTLQPELPRNPVSESPAVDNEDLGALPNWNLTDLYPSLESEELQADLAKAETLAKDFQDSYQGKLAEYAEQAADNTKLLDAIKAYEELQLVAGRIISFAFLVYAADSATPEHSKFYGDMQEKLTSISSRLLFFTLELNRVPDDVLDKAVGQENLSFYKPWFEDLRKEKPYQLDDQLEKLFNEKSVTGRMAWSRLFTETTTSLKFDVDGEELALEPTLNLLMNPDQSKRKLASEALSKVFEQSSKTFALITNTLAKDKEISDRWRSFEDVADSMHLHNRVEREVVEAMVSSVQGKYPALSHRYYALKAKWLKQDKLNHWDRNAPLTQSADRKIPWSEAQTIVLEAYGKFSSSIAGIAQDFFDKNWIDAPVSTGKRPGAFSHPTVTNVHPYILVNYLGTKRDVMTLAHELGHGVHQVLAREQGPLLAPTPLTLAETASVFGEMLTFKALLAQETDPERRRILIASKVEDMINTVVRQVAFYTFEREVHLQRRNGELTAEQIGEIWLNVQRESLGPSVDITNDYRFFWCYIPHFISSPFYVYAYAFGDCLVNSLYAQYEQSPDGFEEKYINMLRAGGSKNHVDLLAPFNLNATDPNFWDMGLSVIEKLIDELETI